MSGRVNSENVFVAPTRKGETLPKLADLLKNELFVVLEEGESFSTRVYSPCGSKVTNFVACVASVSVWFRSKEIPRKGTFGFDRARNETRATFLAVFDSRSSFFCGS